ELTQAEGLLKLRDPGGDGRGRHSRQLAEIFEQLPAGQPVVELGVAGEIADPLPHVAGALIHVKAFDPRRARGGDEDRGEHAEGGRFPGAVSAEQPEDPTRGAGEGDVPDRGDIAFLAVVEGLTKVQYFDQSDSGSLAGKDRPEACARPV